MNQRLQNICDYLKNQQIDAAFINAPENFFYLSGFQTDPHERLLGMMVFPHTKPIAIIPEMEAEQLRQSGWDSHIIGYQDHENPWELLKDDLNKREIINVKTIGLEKNVLSYGRSESLLGMFPNVNVVDVEVQLNHMRVVKDEEEIAVMREAAELADYGIKIGVDALDEGVSEMEVLAKIEFELKKKGVREMSFSTMVLFGENSGSPHGNPGNRTLKSGDFVLFDLGVEWKGYTSDITRTFAFKHITSEQEDIYQTVLNAQLAALDISQPGTRIGDLDQTARDIIEAAGFGDRFPHRLGHGIGINVHEFPSMSHLNNDKLKAGMTYTIEPGIYDSKLGGVRIEDDVLVKANGCETLTRYPKELQVIT
ncbi:Xaa-Pro peptidase family protein [Thalassobacillus sp. CUG 92003]|uniref:M24 family metallopeptidase n=1 Tax=Thalassobacillus sp. CUG 92003 TaxID=2736641 RepID=UPI0015E669D4|nr:Xaa-Pro peptidase family protein [Thalassobacillus sp. CUG 92003]